MAHLVAANQSSDKTLLYDEAVALLGHDGPVLSSQFSPDGACIASGGMDRTIRLWHLPTDAYEKVPNYGIMDQHKSAVTSIRWKNSDTLFSTSADTTVAFWDTVTGERLVKGQGHELTVNDCCVGTNGSCASVGDDGGVRFWDDRQKASVSVIDSPYPLLCCSYSPDGSTIFVAGIEAKVKAYEIKTGNLLWSCQVGRDIITGLDVNSDGSRIVVRLANGQVVSINASRSVPDNVSRIGPSYEGISPKYSNSLVRACFSKDDLYIGSGSDSAESFIWETASRRTQVKLEDHQSSVLQLDFHPTEKIVLTCSNDGNIIVRQL